MTGDEEDEDLRLARLLASVPEVSHAEFTKSVEQGTAREEHCIVSQRASDIPPEHRIAGAKEAECDDCGELILLSPTSQEFLKHGVSKKCVSCMLVDRQKAKPEEMRIALVPGARAEMYRHVKRTRQ